MWSYVAHARSMASNVLRRSVETAPIQRRRSGSTSRLLAVRAQPVQRGVHLGPYAGARELALAAALLLDLEVDLLAEHGDVARCLDSDPHLLAHDRENRHLDVVPDHDALIRLPGQDQHSSPPCLAARSAHINSGDAAHATGRAARRSICIGSAPELWHAAHCDRT